MKIDGNNPINAGNIYQVQQNKNAVDKQLIISRSDSDQIEISEQARKISELVEKAVELPEVRVEKVEALKEKISEGSYVISARELAIKMLLQK
ncbi:MAG: flagellar biosynthesis anti-sigma factor FlgM [Syntrophomonadaceae bacterium]|nr:flagellar biosynthesis anti-sigma factor FlgM [Syntrophomonadaceae bacterium]